MTCVLFPSAQQEDTHKNPVALIEIDGQQKPQAVMLWHGKHTMSKHLLSVIIDERKNLESLNSQSIMAGLNAHSKSSNSQRQVFKDYILSSEVFYVDTEPS